MALLYVSFSNAKELREKGTTDATATAFVAMFLIQQVSHHAEVNI